MNQDEVRILLNDYLIKSGVKAKHVALNVEMYPELLSQFRHGKKNLWSEHLEKLEQYLKSKM